MENEGEAGIRKEGWGGDVRETERERKEGNFIAWGRGGWRERKRWEEACKKAS